MSKLKDGTYVINLNTFEAIGTHWIALYGNDDNRSPSYDATYFDSFAVEHIPKEIKKFIENKNIITNLYKIQAYDSMMCGCFCIGLIDFKLGKSLLDLKNIFSSNEYEKNDKIILRYFQ